MGTTVKGHCTRTTRALHIDDTNTLRVYVCLQPVHLQ